MPHSDDWATPKWLYDKLDGEFKFDFDPCPLNTGEISPDRDGLIIEWGWRNFVNPPYSRKLKHAFIAKAVLESLKGKLCVLLLPVSTSSLVFHQIILPNAKEIRFIKGRVKFLGINTRGDYTVTGSPMHDSMIVVFDGRAITTSHECACNAHTPLLLSFDVLSSEQGRYK